MKRILILFGLLIVSSGLVYAVTNTLIDFTELGADFPDEDNPEHHRETTMNFSSAAGSTFTDEEKDLMLISLALDEWRVELASSAATVSRMAKSYCKEAQTSPNASDYNGENMQSRTILGVRVNFPESAFNSYAIIKPPFEVQAYQDQLTFNDDLTYKIEDNDKGEADMFVGKGVLKNVGSLKSIAVSVYGANFPHALEIILQDQNYVQKSYHIAYLDHDGWATHVWENPNYIEDVRNREINIFPLYPHEEPYMKFIGFIIYRDASTLGGDFVTYFKDVVMTYDEALPSYEEEEIDNELMWGILTERTEKRRTAEYKRLGQQQILEMLEKQKQHSETSGTSE